MNTVIMICMLLEVILMVILIATIFKKNSSDPISENQVIISLAFNIIALALVIVYMIKA